MARPLWAGGQGGCERVWDGVFSNFFVCPFFFVCGVFALCCGFVVFVFSLICVSCMFLSLLCFC